MDNFKFQIGETVKDVVTGFKGVIMSRIQYMTGCNQYGLFSQKNAIKDGKYDGAYTYLDENRLVLQNIKRISLQENVEMKKVRGCDGNPPHPPIRI